MVARKGNFYLSPFQSLPFLFANDAEITNIWRVPSVSIVVRWACSLILVKGKKKEKINTCTYGLRLARAARHVGASCSLSAC